MLQYIQERSTRVVLAMASASPKPGGVPCGSLFLAISRAATEKAVKDAIDANQDAIARLRMGMDAYYSTPK